MDEPKAPTSSPFGVRDLAADTKAAGDNQGSAPPSETPEPEATLDAAGGPDADGGNDKAGRGKGSHKAKRLGSEDYLQGRAIDENPYPATSRNYTLWRSGWRHQQSVFMSGNREGEA